MSKKTSSPQLNESNKNNFNNETTMKLDSPLKSPYNKILSNIIKRKGSAIWSSPDLFDDNGYNVINEIKITFKTKQQQQQQSKSKSIIKSLNDKFITRRLRLTEQSTLVLSEISSSDSSSSETPSPSPMSPIPPISSISSSIFSPKFSPTSSTSTSTSSSPSPSSPTLLQSTLEKLYIDEKQQQQEPLLSMKYQSFENIQNNKNNNDGKTTTVETIIKIRGKLINYNFNDKQQDQLEQHKHQQQPEQQSDQQSIKSIDIYSLFNDDDDDDIDQQQQQRFDTISSFENLSKTKIINDNQSKILINYNDDLSDSSDLNDSSGSSDLNDFIKIKKLSSKFPIKIRQKKDEKFVKKLRKSKEKIIINDDVEKLIKLIPSTSKSKSAMKSTKKIKLINKRKRRRKKFTGTLFKRITKSNRQLRLYIHRMFHKIVNENEDDDINSTDLNRRKILISNDSIEFLNSISKEIINKFANYADQLLLYSGRNRLDRWVAYSTLQMLLSPILNQYNRRNSRNNRITFQNIINDNGYYEYLYEFKII